MCADGLNGKKQVIRCSFGSFSWLHIKVVCLLGCLTILEIGMNLYCWFFFYFLSLLRLQIFETVTTSCIDGLSICKSISPSNFHKREWDWREKGPFGNSTVNSAKASWSGCIFDAPLHNSRGSALLEFMRKHTRTVCPGCKQSVAQLTEVATFTVHFIWRPFNSRQKELSAHFCDVIFVMTIWKIENECKKSSNLLLFLLSFF